jgi:hypothetical protein
LNVEKGRKEMIGKIRKFMEEHSLVLTDQERLEGTDLFVGAQQGDLLEIRTKFDQFCERIWRARRGR